MKLLLVGHDDRYAIEQLQLALFPDETMEPAGEAFSGDGAVSALHAGKLWLTATARITLHGVTARASRRMKLDEADVPSRRRLLQNAYYAAATRLRTPPEWGSLSGVRPTKLTTRHLLAGGTEQSADRLMKETYHVAPARRRLCVESSLASLRAAERLRPGDVSLYIGMEDALHMMYPRDIVTEEHLIIDPDSGQIEKSRDIPDIARRLLGERGLAPENEMQYAYLDIPAVRDGDRFDFNPDGYSDELGGDIYALVILSADDFNALTGSGISLAEDEARVYSPKQIYGGSEIYIAGLRLRVSGSELTPDEFSLADVYTLQEQDKILYIVVSDRGVVEDIARLQTGNDGASLYPLREYYAFDLDAPDETADAVFEQLSGEVTREKFSGRLDTQSESRDAFLGMYGGLFFLGIFLGLTFMMAAVLIIYYKQVSEGYEDKERFAIMQKVGLSRKEVRRAIRAQILTMFFLPLVVACIHIAFAFPVITRLLRILYLTNVPLFAACTAGSIAVFAVFYAVVFSLTAKVYYRIVGES